MENIRVYYGDHLVLENENDDIVELDRRLSSNKKNNPENINLPEVGQNQYLQHYYSHNKGMSGFEQIIDSKLYLPTREYFTNSLSSADFNQWESKSKKNVLSGAKKLCTELFDRSTPTLFEGESTDSLSSLSKESIKDKKNEVQIQMIKDCKYSEDEKIRKSVVNPMINEPVSVNLHSIEIVSEKTMPDRKYNYPSLPEMTQNQQGVKFIYMFRHTHKWVEIFKDESMSADTFILNPSDSKVENVLRGKLSEDSMPYYIIDSRRQEEQKHGQNNQDEAEEK